MVGEAWEASERLLKSDEWVRRLSLRDDATNPCRSNHLRPSTIIIRAANEDS